MKKLTKHTGKKATTTKKGLKTVEMMSVFSLFSGPWKCTCPPKTDQRVQMIAGWTFPYCDLWPLVQTDLTPVLALPAANPQL